MLSAQPARPQVPSQAERAFRETAILDVDSTALKRLETISDYIDEQQWSQAVEILLQLSSQKGGSLVPFSAGRYVNISHYCQLILSTFPSEGLEVYRKQVRPRLNQAYQQAVAGHDAAALKVLLDEAFLSDFGDDALLLLGEWAWENGNFSAARSYWTQLVPLPAPELQLTPPIVLRYPDSDFPQPEILARLALCTLMEADFVRFELELSAFRSMYPDAAGTVAGRTGKLVDTLAALSTEAKGWSKFQNLPQKNTFGLSSSRNGILSESLQIGPVQWSVELFGYQPDSEFPHPAFGNRHPLSTFPLVHAGNVLFCDADRIVVLDLQTGKPAWPVSDLAEQDTGVIYPSFPGEKSPRPDRPAVGVPWYSLTVEEGRLYAKMGTPITDKSSQELRPLESSLVCLNLDQKQGQLEWKVTSEEIEPGGSAWMFEGSPVVAGDNVFSALRGSTPETEAAVACFSAETGELKWLQKVCSSVRNLDDQFSLVSHQLLTLGDGTLFYSTEMGAIVALNSRNGTIRWVATYETSPDENPTKLGDANNSGLLPCLYHRGSVVAAPNDSEMVFALDAQTGLLKWKRRLGSGVRHLLGVSENRLFLSGDTLWCLDVETGSIQWKVADSDPEYFGYGRGVLSNGNVYWPLREEIFVVDQRSGQLNRRIALKTQFGEMSGNLLISAGRLLIAQPNRLTVLGVPLEKRKAP
jgi:outer membrane protein assembly factor BamB